jgi:hypothetical protein
MEGRKLKGGRFWLQSRKHRLEGRASLEGAKSPEPEVVWSLSRMGPRESQHPMRHESADL